VTPSVAPHSIEYVPETIATVAGRRPVLTKRRAVDFCHVATAICCPSVCPLPA
jgi:hypothetical protein